MGTRTTKTNFLQTVAEEGPKVFSQLCFKQTGPATFWRELGKITQGFFLTPNSSFTHISVDVGASIPTLNERLDYGRGGHCASLLVSRPLGLLGKVQNGRTFYYFATVEELRDLLPKVYSDFIEQAEPWLETLVTVEDVANEFHKWRIAPPSPGVSRPPDPFAWALYGWLLHEAGKPLEAQPWLERALEQLKEPAFHTKGGHFVPIGTPGTCAVPRTPEENRLIELLKNDQRIT